MRGKVIPFGKPRKQPATPVHTMFVTPGQAMDPAFIEDLISRLGASGITVGKMLRIQNHLNQLTGPVSRQSIAIRRQGLRGHTEEELLDLANNSNESDWTSRPAFYRALVDEYTSRV